MIINNKNINNKYMNYNNNNRVVVIINIYVKTITLDIIVNNNTCMTDNIKNNTNNHYTLFTY